MTDRIEAQVERFAPGFRDRILARAAPGRPQMEAHDANYVGGDINGGIQDIRQLFFRPWPSLDPYRRRATGSICARRPRRPAAASTACAVCWRPARRCATSCADRARGHVSGGPPGTAASLRRP